MKKSKKGNKILLIPEFSTSGGTLIYFKSLVDCFLSNNFNVIIVLTEKQYDILKNDGYSIEKQKIIIRNYNIKSYPYNILPDLFFLLKMYLVHKFSTITLSLQSPGSYISSFILPVKVNYIIHSRITSSGKGPFKIKNFLYIFKSSKKKIIVVSDYSKIVVKKFWNYKFITTLYNYSRFNNQYFNKSYDYANIITIGHIVDYKNPLIWIKTAIKTLDNTNKKMLKFIWAGEGDCKIYLNEIPDKYKDQIVFVDHIEAVEGLFANALIYFHPSLVENLSLSIIEALSFSLPIVAYNTGGNAELVKDYKNGRIIGSNDPDEFSKAILSIIEDKETYIQMSISSYGSYSMNFTLQEWHKNIVKLHSIGL